MKAFRQAGTALEKVPPSGARDMTAAFNRDRSLIDDAANGRTAAAVRAMVLESELRTSPERRAERFVGDWRKLSRAGSALIRCRRGGCPEG